MKPFRPTLQIILFVLVAAFCGCEPAKENTGHLAHQTKNNASDTCMAYTPYEAIKINIMPLTEFTPGQNASGITAYVSLTDSFNCQKKSPGVFRFELYHKLLRSAQPRGRRIIIWDDIDLTDPGKNNRHWQDFLRAYRFSLDFDPENGTEYILHATCIRPDGKRLSTEFDLK